MIHSYLYSSGRGTIERVTKSRNLVQIKFSFILILVNILLWVKFFIAGFVLDEFSSLFDWISLYSIVFLLLFSLMCFLSLLDGYGWGLAAKLTSIVAITFSIASLVYVYNISSSDSFNTSGTKVIDAKVMSKGTWSKRGSLVLATSDDVLTYNSVLNSTEVLVGDSIVSVSEGELVRTYTDLLGLKTERRMKGLFLNKSLQEEGTSYEKQ